MSYERSALARLAMARLRQKPTVRLGTLASELRVDRHTLNRAFRMVYGTTFAKLKGQLRADAINDALEDPRPKSLKETAEEVGLGSGAELARVTRRLFGATPTVIRKRRSRG